MADGVREGMLLLDCPLSDEAGRLLEQTIVERHRRRKRIRAAARTLAIVVLASTGAVVGVRHASGPRIAAVPVPGTSVRTVRFDDGSEVTLLDAASTLKPQRVTPEQTVVELVGGSARFNVVPHPTREFRAQAGNVTIDVLGTVFTVDRYGAGARVSVERGHVRVRWRGGEAHLVVGETGVFPPQGTEAAPPPASEAPPPEPAPAVAPPAPVVAPPEPALPAPHPAARAPRPATTPRAEEPPAPATHPAGRDEVEDLLLAADVARRAHRPREAVAPLRRLLDEYPSDQRAPMAAFTLGRLLLEDVHSAAEAAAAYARARALDPRGPLAEHALAREVEAWAAAGQHERARAAAEVYVREYPDGSRARSVRRLGGLE
jgi:hypothetical protein